MTIDSLQMELALASRLELLKASDQDVFLDATLACLRLVQNILEHSHNERYRRLRGSAPVSAKRAQEGTYWKCTCTTSPCIFAMAFVACVLYICGIECVPASRAVAAHFALSCECSQPYMLRTPADSSQHSFTAACMRTCCTTSSFSP